MWNQQCKYYIRMMHLRFKLDLSSLLIGPVATCLFASHAWGSAVLWCFSPWLSVKAAVNVYAGCPHQIGLSLGRARLCEFSGQYYCESCHRGDTSIIPSRMLHNWDLTAREVSSYDLVIGSYLWTKINMSDSCYILLHLIK